MNRRQRASLLALLIGTAAAGSGLRAQGVSPQSPPRGFTLDWAVRATGGAHPPVGLVVADLDGDGVDEIVSSAWHFSQVDGQSYVLNYWYVYKRSTYLGYEPDWVGPLYRGKDHTADLTALKALQADSDPALEIVAALPGRVLVYDGITRALERTIPTDIVKIRGLAAGDFDRNGSPEIALCGQIGFRVIDLASGAVRLTQPFDCRDLAAGNVDDDPALEIVVAGGDEWNPSIGNVVDGQTGLIQWTLPTGFGDFVRLADLDSDGKDEIVAGFRRQERGIEIFDGDVQALTATIDVGRELGSLYVGDLDGDGRPEIAYAGEIWAEIQVLDGATRLLKWSLWNPDSAVAALAAGDTDGDGFKDLVFASRRLHVASTATRRIEWSTGPLDGPFQAISHGDVDGDGRPELLHASYTTQQGSAGGVWFVHDAATKAVEFRSQPFQSSSYAIATLRNAQVDDDPQQEIFLVSDAEHSGAELRCYDGLTHELQWSALPSQWARWVGALQVADLDGDGGMEVVATAIGNSYQPQVYALDAATGVVKWRVAIPAQPAGALRLLRLGNVDDDDAVEIVVGSERWPEGGTLSVVDGVTHQVQALGPQRLRSLALADRDRNGRAEILVGTVDGDVNVVDPASGLVVERVLRRNRGIDALAVFVGESQTSYFVASESEVFEYPGSSQCPLRRTGPIGAFVGWDDSLIVADVDGDDRLEVVVNIGKPGIDVYELDAPEPYCVADTSVVEGDAPGTEAEFTVFLSVPASEPLVFAYQTADGSAFAPWHYTATSGSLQIDPGATSGTIRVPVRGDTRADFNTSFFLDVSVGSETPRRARAVILEDDVLGPRFRFEPEEVDFGHVVKGTPLRASFVARNVGGEVLLGTAKLESETLEMIGPTRFEIPPGGAQTFTLVSNGSGSPGGLVRFSGAGAAGVWARSNTDPLVKATPLETLAGGNVSVFVANGPATPTDWVGIYRVDEPDKGPLRWKYLNGSQSPPSQGRTSATLDFALPREPGSYEARFFRSNQTWRLAISDPINVAALPSLSITDASVLEGEAGSVTANFSVSLAGRPATPVSVRYATRDGSASSSSDYTAVSGVVTFAPGETTKTISVPVRGDAVCEPDEAFWVDLSGATPDVALQDREGRGSILHDEPDCEALSCPRSIAPGATLDARILVGTSSSDWLALYAANAPDSPSPSNWRYVPLPRPQWQTFAVPTSPGNYQLRLFADNGYSRLGACQFEVAVRPTLAIDDVSVAEGNAGSASIVFTVTLSPAAVVPVTVEYASANGSATAGADYIATSGTLTFAAGETTKTITVAINGDTTQEPTETLSVNLDAPTGGAVLGRSQGLGTIRDDDAPPAIACPSLVNPGAGFNATVREGTSAADWLALYAVGAPDRPAPANWRYAALPRPQTQSFTAPTAPGGYELRLFTDNGYTLLGSCPFTVAVVPTLSIGDASVTEGHSGTTVASFDVTLSPAASGPVTVAYATAHDTAGASDYLAQNGTLNFAAGVTTQSVTIFVNGDALLEKNESFTVNLSNATGGAVVGRGQGRGTILDDDAPPTVACPATVNPAASFSASVNGGESAIDWLALYPAGAPDKPAPSSWRYVPTPRPQPQSFLAPSAAGSYELRLFANNGYTRIGVCPFTVAVVPTLAIDDVSVAEGNAGTATATFTVTLSPAATGPVSVAYATANDTANGSDYAAASGTLSFAAGETSKTLAVTINGDTTLEQAESFLVNLSNPTGGAFVGRGQGRGTIRDDDAPPALACPATVAAGASFTAAVNAGSSATDWLALYAAGQADRPAPANWRYVPQPRPQSQGFIAPAAPGSYELRLFADNGYTPLGACSFSVP